MKGLSRACRRGRNAASWAAVILATLAVFGCGKKGPPTLPEVPEPPAVTDLAHRIDGGSVVLTWSVDASALKGVSGFYVYRSVSSLDDPPCDDCPIVFEKTGILSAEGRYETAGRFTFREPVAKNHRYLYKVVGYRDASGEGKPSNTVRFEVPGAR